MTNPLIRDWETSWYATSIRNLSYHAYRRKQSKTWSSTFANIGDFEWLLFNFYLCEAALDEYIRTHGDWGDELIRLPASELPGGDLE